MKNFASTHIDGCWQTSDDANAIAFEVESAIVSSLAQIGGHPYDEEWMSKYWHQKVRITVSVEILEDGKE